MDAEEHDYEASSDTVSGSFPLPFGWGSGRDRPEVPDKETPGIAGVEETGILVDGEGVLGADSCHAGMEGFDGSTGVVNPLVLVGPRLRSSAFRDLSSCCSSARDCV